MSVEALAAPDRFVRPRRSEKNMALNLTKAISHDERHSSWVSVIERIYLEQINQGWRHQLFRLFRSVFDANPRLSERGGFLFNWMAENYVDTTLMLIRRELDKQAGTENLRNLLKNIIKHPGVLTRARYIAQWQPGKDMIANRAFDSFNPIRVPGSPKDDYINPDIVEADLAQVIKAAEGLRTYAERTRAHRTPEQGVDSFTYKDLHQAIADIRKVVGKYYAILTLSSVMDWEPVAQYNTLEPFMEPWVTDQAAVDRIADEDIMK